MLGGKGLQWWNYALILIGVLGLLYSVLPIFQKEKEPAKNPVDDNLYAEIIALAELLQLREATFEQRRRYHTILARHLLFTYDDPDDYEGIIRKARSLARYA